MMKPTHFRTAIKWLWSLPILIMPLTGIAESYNITIDASFSKDGLVVMFYLKNHHPNKDFICSSIRAKAKLKNAEGRMISRQAIIAQDVLLLAGKWIELPETKSQTHGRLKGLDELRIMSVSEASYSCKPKVFRDRLKDGSLGPEMVWIPAGSFKMGDIQGGGDSDEHPVHRVSVEKFAMGRYEITFAEYDKFAQATGREKPDDRGSGRGNRPVIYVSWHDVKAYADWLSQQTGQNYRLPTEAEWEYAARAGTNTKYWWGNEIGANKANCSKKYCKDNFKYTAPVGSFMANPFGLHDTAGNVWEWTCSEYEKPYQGKEKRCVSNASLFALRGGSWYTIARWTRAAYRYRNEPTNRSGNLGVRLARHP
jgi:formylglycine-generating enzyme required for sulfatase activity